MKTNAAPNMQIVPYPQKVPELPNVRLIKGKVYVNAKEATHNALTAMDTAWERTRLGNISEIRTQVTGARVSA